MATAASIVVFRTVFLLASLNRTNEFYFPGMAGQSQIGIVWHRRNVLRLKIMASRSVNKVILIGHLGRDAETAYTASQTAVTKFSVATSRRWKDQQTGEWKEETDWTRVVLWRGENVAPYLTKGTQVYVEGRLQTRSYDDKDGKKVWATEVVADQVILLGGRGAGAGAGASMDESFSQEPPASGMRSQPRGKQASAPSGPPMGSDGITDDDVPF
jgi:single-strand DNA-binding protein